MPNLMIDKIDEVDQSAELSLINSPRDIKG